MRFLLVIQDRDGWQRRDLVHILLRLDPALRIGAATRLVSSDLMRHGVPARDLFLDGRAACTVLLWLAYTGTQMTLNFLTSWLPTVVH